MLAAYKELQKHIAKPRKTNYTTLMPTTLPPRAPWSDDFPDVIVHGDEKVRDAHPSYLAAKSGDVGAALQLAVDLMDPLKIQTIVELAAASNAFLLAVSADEASGFNAIPDAMALHLDILTDIPVSIGDIVQSNKVAHTKSKSLQRIVAPATFTGKVEKNRNYLIIDDHTGLGGTLANLRGYIETAGGNVIGCTTMTASPNSHVLGISKSSQLMLIEKYGPEINGFWMERFGHDIECLTEREAKAILVCRAQSLDALEAQLAQAAEEVRLRGL
jgi:hypothetical protein